MTLNKSLCATAVGLALASTSAFATNGMNMDAYGPIAGGMGGASMAYDNGTAAMMNNPATLGMMADGTSMDIALGVLGPNITSTYGGTPSDSAATSFLMPAFGYASKSGKLAWAAGVFAQGGMGAEYSATSPLAAGSGDKVRSEVGVGRAMLAAAYNVNDRLNVGGSLDLVWAGMDLKMAVPASMLVDAPGGLITGRGGAFTAFDFTAGATWGRFDFSNGSPFTGEAKGYGFGAKLGLTYKVSDNLSVGATYHSQTNLSDLQTDNAALSTDAVGTATGTIKVRDFQWPATYGVGISFTPNSQTQVALDVKRIMWADVMENFKMTFITSAFGGGSVDVAMPQNWDNQTVVQGGVSYQYNPKLTLRAGFNFASNPVPDQFLNPLFPATIEKHFTLGFGYKVSDQGDLNASLTYAPKVTDVSWGNDMAPGGGDDITVEHSQFAGQVMYSHRF